MSDILMVAYLVHVLNIGEDIVKGRCGAVTQPRLWVDEIHEALTSLGGSASLADIYNEVWRRNNMDFVENRHWRDAIRRTIQQHSSDSSIFTGIPGDDIFYAPLGLGAGIWALRG